MLCSQIFSKQNYIHFKIPVSGSSILKFLSNFANFSLDTTDDLQCSWDSFQTFKRRLTWFVRSSPNQGCTVQTRPYQVTVIYCVACKLLKYLMLKPNKKKNDINRERNKEVNLQFWHVFKWFFFPIQCFLLITLTLSSTTLDWITSSKCETQLFRALLIITSCFYPRIKRRTCDAI